MDLGQYTLEDLILSALKSEVDAKAVYSAIAEGVTNAYLQSRLRFLAEEEEKHRVYLEALFISQFPGRELVLPDRTPVPLPAIDLPSDHVPLSTVFNQAMTAESTASEFYADVALRFDEGSEERAMLLDFSKMEMGHYELLKQEMDAASSFEDFDTNWPMMHAGP
jgi:rubrerythrin